MAQIHLEGATPTGTPGERLLTFRVTGIDPKSEKRVDAISAQVQNILADGKVGIANTAPATALDVTGEIRASTAGTNDSSVVTVGGTQTLTNKTLTAPVINNPTGFLTGAAKITVGTSTPSSPNA